MRAPQHRLAHLGARPPQDGREQQPFVPAGDDDLVGGGGERGVEARAGLPGAAVGALREVVEHDGQPGDAPGHPPPGRQRGLGVTGEHAVGDLHRDDTAGERTLPELVEPVAAQHLCVAQVRLQRAAVTDDAVPLGPRYDVQQPTHGVHPSRRRTSPFFSIPTSTTRGWVA